jgi:hypothetical protein
VDISLSGYAGIELKDDMLFLMENRQEGDLIVLSVENPADPFEIARHPLAEDMRVGKKVRVIGDRIYVHGLDNLAIFDFQNANAITFLGKIKIESPSSLGALVVKGPYAYVFVSGQIRIFDVSNPQEIEQTASVKATWCPYAVLREGHIFGFGRNGIFVFDLAEPLQPQLVRKHYNRMPGHVLIGQDQNFVVHDDGHVEFLIGLPYFPDNFQSRFGFTADNVVVSENYAYTLGEGRLYVIDISRPWSPKTIASVGARSVSRCTIAVKGDYLYTPREIIDISEPANPVKVKNLKGGTGLAVAGAILFVAKDKELQIWDVNRPANADIMKTITFDERLNRVFVHKGLLYLGFHKGKLRSGSFEEDLSLTTLSEIELTKARDGFIMDFHEEDDLLYIALNDGGVVSVDIQDPQKLTIHARFNTSQFSEQVRPVDAFAYVADGSGGVLVIDMARKGFEKKIAAAASTDWTRSIAIAGNYVFSCESENGVAVLVSNLSKYK